MSLQCKKCLTSRTGDQLGAPCRTPGCDGVIEETPKFSTLVDELPEPMTCPRRIESPTTIRDAKDQDRWQRFKSNGNRVCSYCGSLHPNDMLALVSLSAKASVDAAYHTVVEIEPSDKSYKVYVNQPGVRNAMEGGIKFYVQHMRKPNGDYLIPTEEQMAEYRDAVRNTKVRFERHLAEVRRNLERSA